MESVKNEKDKYIDNERFYAYLAGLIDGEGCIHVAKAGCNQLRISITNANGGCLKYIKNRMGGKIHKRKKKLNHKSSFRLIFSGKIAFKILGMIIPYLIVKEKEAKEALKYPFYGNRYGNKGKKLPKEIKFKREKIMNKLQSLKRIGIAK
jgi:hypothetical protein